MANNRKLRGGGSLPSSSGSKIEGISALMPFISGAAQVQKQQQMMPIELMQEQMKRQEALQHSGQGFQQAIDQFGGKQNVPVDAKVNLGTGAVTADLNRKYSSEEATSLSGADNISRHLSFIREKMNTDPNFSKNFQKATFRLGGGEKGQVMGVPTSMGDKESQKLSFHLGDLGSRLVYLLSGKQINEQEYQRLSRNLPSWSDLSDPNDKRYEVLNEKLNSFEQDMNNIRGRLIKGGNYDSRYWEDAEDNSNLNPSAPSKQTNPVNQSSMGISSIIPQNLKSPSRQQAPKGAYGWSKSKQSWVDEAGNVVQ